MRIKLHPENPQPRLIKKVIDCLRSGGVIIYPTDTVYGLGCDIHNKKAIERICRIKGIRPEKAQFSCICEDLKIIGEYTVQVSTPVYKIMKRAFPGPYTFILQASKAIPRHFQSKKKTVGIRVVDNPIANAIVHELGNPLVSSSLNSDDNFVGYDTDPDVIYERYHKQVDMVVDGGFGHNEPSTVIDCSRGEHDIEIIREGIGSIDILN